MEKLINSSKFFHTVVKVMGKFFNIGAWICGVVAILVWFLPMSAFEGGEDYALLGTCPAEAWPSFEKLFSDFSVPAAGLGTVRRGPITLNGSTPPSAGFDHFSA